MSTLGRSRTTAPTRRRRTATRVALLAALLATAPLLAGCGALGATEESADSPRGGSGVVVGAPNQADGRDSSAGGGVGGEASDPAPDQEFIITGSMYLTVEAPLEAADEAVRIVESAGGRIDGRREFAPRAGGRTTTGGVDDSGLYAPDGYEYEYRYGYGFPGDGGGAVLELRIPAATLTETLDRLSALGDVEELLTSTVDVTAEVRDIEARITALRSSIGRLLALQDDAASVEDLIALETAISDRQAELESLESQQRYFADQVSLSTIVLTLGSEDVAPADEPDTFWTGLLTGWEALTGFIGGLLVVTGVLLPWLLVLGVLALLAWVLVRRALRRRADPSRRDASADPQPQPRRASRT